MSRSWPPIRNWRVSPPQGGWGVTYAGRAFNGTRPSFVYENVLRFLDANKLKDTPEQVKRSLEQQWKSRDPARWMGG